MIIAIYAEKASDKIQEPHDFFFYIYNLRGAIHDLKTLGKLRLKRNFFKLVKNTYNNQCCVA